jgi:Zn-dependent peptidase ImmA (M78 family)
MEVIFTWSSNQGGDLLIPSDLPLVERRFILAQELLNAVMLGLHEQVAGLSELLIPDLKDNASYFARVFLAPDPMVEAYREEGRDYKGFAATFLLPEHAASKRWQDPLFPPRLEENLHLPFSHS